MDDELLLGPGISVEAVLDSLKLLIVDVKNIAGAGGGNFDKLWNDYLSWVEAAEFHLPGLFRSPIVWQELHNARYPTADGTI